MRREQYGDGDEEVVFVLGWGNKPEQENPLWMTERLLDAGYRVTVFEIPVVIADFEAEYLDPVVGYLDTLDAYRLLTHSTGGLIGRYVDDDAMLTRTYLSPWWGFHEDLQNPIVSLAMKLPVSWAFLPAGIEKEDLGDLGTERQVEQGPDGAAPSFLREVDRAQREMPAFDTDDAVFYSPTDPVVGVDAIEAQAPAENRVAYDGGHELFSSSVRDDHIEAVLAAVDEGANTL